MLFIRIYKVDSRKSVGFARLHFNVIFPCDVKYWMYMQAGKFNVAVEELS